MAVISHPILIRIKKYFNSRKKVFLYVKKYFNSR